MQNQNFLYFKYILSLVLSIFIFLAGCKNDNKTSLIKSKENVTQTIQKKEFKVAVGAMVSPRNTYEYYNELIAFLAKKIGFNYKFVQRKTYKEVNSLLEKGEVDIAFICSGAYKIAMKSFDPPIVCVPVMYGEPYYQAVLITHSNSKYKSINLLKGATIAFTDSLSNSGYMYLNDYFKKNNINSDSIFSKKMFSGGHDVSIAMVQKGLVDVATVDKLILDYIRIEKPELVSNVKEIYLSPKFGIPPIVASKKADPNLVKSLQKELLNIHLDNDGKKIISKIHIDKFILGKKKDYQNVPIYQ